MWVFRTPFSLLPSLCSSIRRRGSIQSQFC
jgi:hypothetical protein